MSTHTGILELRQQRLDNLRKLTELGHNPYGQAFIRSGRLADIKAEYAEGLKVKAAGRIVAVREMGKSIFAHLQDGTGRLQVYVKKDAVPEEAFTGFQILDIGDIIGVEGHLFTTRTGEQSIHLETWTLLSKSLLPLPDKWDGLEDVDTRYRQRYLDLIANEDSRKVFHQRIAIVAGIRAFLGSRGFAEVETPMMQAIPGGAAATPFKTHYNALNTEMFLRIAPELYLKRLLVGGFDKVFELNRNFRNEGLSRFHNPEFTMMEIYEAYGGLASMMELVRSLICHLADTVIGSQQVGFKDSPVDLSVWSTIPYHELIRQTAGDDYSALDLAGKRARAVELGLHVDEAWSEVEVTQEIFEKLIEKTLINPTFVIRLPAELVPLAKPCTDDPKLVEVFELIIGGREIAPGYNELNDPILQRERLLAQAAHDHTKLDEEFLAALEHGMPPAGGMGVGIDRLVMLLTGAESIRDVILFPQLKPRA